MRSTLAACVCLIAISSVACRKKTEPTGSGGAPAVAEDAAAEVVAVAAPAATFCDGVDCPCKLTKWFDKLACELPAPQTIQGVPCGKGEVRFFTDGHLAECSLAADVRVGPYLCQQGGAVFWLHENGNLERCYTRGRYKIGDYDVEDTHFGNFDLQLYPDGSLMEGPMAKPRAFGKLTCYHQVELYKSGKPYLCKIDAPFTDGDLSLPARTHLLLSPEGKPIGFFPQEDMIFRGKKLSAGYPECLQKDCNSMPDE
jgi:hypothetical protein